MFVDISVELYCVDRPAIRQRQAEADRALMKVCLAVRLRESTIASSSSPEIRDKR